MRAAQRGPHCRVQAGLPRQGHRRRGARRAVRGGAGPTRGFACHVGGQARAWRARKKRPAATGEGAAGSTQGR